MPKITELHTVSYTKLEFNHGASMSYGKRVGFVDLTDRSLLKTNPRDEIGKLGIRHHGEISKLFYSTAFLFNNYSQSTNCSGIRNRKS